MVSHSTRRLNKDFVQILNGLHFVERRVTPRAFKELVAERCPEHEKFMAPMLERVMLIRGKEKA